MRLANAAPTTLSTSPVPSATASNGEVNPADNRRLVQGQQHVELPTSENEAS